LCYDTETGVAEDPPSLTMTHVTGLLGMTALECGETYEVEPPHATIFFTQENVVRLEVYVDGALYRTLNQMEIDFGYVTITGIVDGETKSVYMVGYNEIGQNTVTTCTEYLLGKEPELPTIVITTVDTDEGTVAATCGVTYTLSGGNVVIGYSQTNAHRITAYVNGAASTSLSGEQIGATGTIAIGGLTRGVKYSISLHAFNYAGDEVSTCSVYVIYEEEPEELVLSLAPGLECGSTVSVETARPPASYYVGFMIDIVGSKTWYDPGNPTDLFVTVDGVESLAYGRVIHDVTSGAHVFLSIGLHSVSLRAVDLVTGVEVRTCTYYVNVTKIRPPPPPPPRQVCVGGGASSCYVGTLAHTPLRFTNNAYPGFTSWKVWAYSGDERVYLIASGAIINGTIVGASKSYPCPNLTNPAIHSEVCYWTR
jgi:hypothetical protein